MTGRTDWVAWHAPYREPDSDLSRRRRSVQAQLAAWLDARPEALLRVVSACSGDGRDLLEVLAGRRDGARVRARLLETDRRLADAAARFAAEHGLAVEVRRDDAGRTDSYVGAVPADLVMMCGVFGNISDEDLRATVRLLPQLCAPGASVVWTRGRFESDLAPRVAGWFEESGFERVALDAPEDTTYRVGVHRLVAEPVPLEPGRTFFTFTR